MRNILIIFLSISSLFCYSQELPTKTEIIETMKLVNDYWIENHTDPGNNLWARAAYFTGNMAFYKVYNDSNYYNYALTWAENNYWAINGGTTTRHADNQCIGQTYLDLFEFHPNPDSTMIEQIDESIRNMVYSDQHDDWWWIDAMYMAMPVFTRLGVMHNDTAYFGQMYRLYYNTKQERSLYNTSDHLWYRDENFSPPYTTPNGLESYWSRGNGWVLGAHARTLEYLPKTDSHWNEYLQTFQDMAQRLIQQQRYDGFWNVSLVDSNDYGGPETSGTSFFTYGIAWGINNGYLDSAVYTPYLAKAWQGLQNIALHPDGYLGYIQGVGDRPAASQPVTYESNSDFGVGAFLLAGSELTKLAGGEMPVPPVRFITNVSYSEPNQIIIESSYVLDESSVMEKSHYEFSSGIEIGDISLSSDQKTITLNLKNIPFGKHSFTIYGVMTGEGYIADDTFSFIKSNVEKVYASGYEDGSENYPENAIDYNLDTRWSAMGDNEWLLLKLTDELIVTSVDIAFFKGNERTAYFDISISLDSISFDSVYSFESPDTTLNPVNYDFEDQKAKYVKITAKGNSSNLWNSITYIHINTLDTYEVSVSICQGESYYAQGANQTATGTYYDTLETVSGHDSIIRTNLTVFPAYFDEINISVCQGESYYAQGANQTETGIYYDTLFTATGCDSIIKTSLSIFPLSIIDLGNDTSIYKNDTIILHAGEGFIEYHWNTGEDSENILVAHQETGTYKYQVNIIDENGCSNSDSIFIEVQLVNSVSHIIGKGNILIFPNPAQSKIFLLSDKPIHSQVLISIYERDGKIMYTEKLNEMRQNFKYFIDCEELKAGIYILKINNSDGVLIEKIIKE